MIKLAVRALLLALAYAVAAEAEEIKASAQPDPVAAGHEFALKVCAACHVVAKDQPSPPLLKPPAPSFETILARRDVTEASLRKTLSVRHGNVGRNAKMPNPMLADFQIDKVIAYMRQLKAEGGGKL